jgi:hypothetical protein
LDADDPDGNDPDRRSSSWEKPGAPPAAAPPPGTLRPGACASATIADGSRGKWRSSSSSGGTDRSPPVKTLQVGRRGEEE